MSAYEGWFQFLDTDRDGKISGAQVADFFRRSNLDDGTLREVSLLHVLRTRMDLMLVYRRSPDVGWEVCLRINKGAVAAMTRMVKSWWEGVNLCVVWCKEMVIEDVSGCLMGDNARKGRKFLGTVVGDYLCEKSVRGFVVMDGPDK